MPTQHPAQPGLTAHTPAPPPTADFSPKNTHHRAEPLADSPHTLTAPAPRRQPAASHRGPAAARWNAPPRPSGPRCMPGVAAAAAAGGRKGGSAPPAPRSPPGPPFSLQPPHSSSFPPPPGAGRSRCGARRCAGLGACRTLTSGACWRAGGGGGGSSRYVRVVLRLLGLRLQRAGGVRRPGRGRAARYRALGHASRPPPPLPPRRPLLFTLRGPHGGRRAQAPPPPLPPRCAGWGGTCSPAARALSANPGRGLRRLPGSQDYNSQWRSAAAGEAASGREGDDGNCSSG